MFGQVVVEIGSLDYCRLPTYVTGAKVKSINQYQFIYIYIININLYIYIYIYKSVETSYESVCNALMLYLVFFNLFSLSFFYYYLIDYNNFFTINLVIFTSFY